MVWVIFLLFFSLEGAHIEQVKESALIHQQEIAVLDIELNQLVYYYQQAHLYPNPVLSITVDGFGKSTSNGNAEVIASLSQAFQIGSKRELKKRIAEINIYEGQFRQQEKKIAFCNKLYHAFFEASFSEEKIKLQKEKLILLDQKLALDQEKVKEGKLNALKVRLTRRDKITGDIELKNRERSLLSNQAELKFLTDEELNEFEGVTWDCPSCHKECNLDEHPTINRILWEREEAYLNYRLEKARVTPDIVVSGGYATTFNNNDTDIIFSVDIPLPLLDQNQVAIKNANLDIEKKDLAYTLAYHKFESAYRKLRSNFENAKEKSERIKNELIPEIDETLKAYENEKGMQGDVIDLKLEKISLLETYLDTLRDLHETWIDIEYFTGEEE